jgi:hypothetical protein
MVQPPKNVAAKNTNAVTRCKARSISTLRLSEQRRLGRQS